MNKQLKLALKRILYCAENDMLGARAKGANGCAYTDFKGRYCAIGCLFTKGALQVLADHDFIEGVTAKYLFSQYPRLEGIFGMTAFQADVLQRMHDDLYTNYKNPSAAFAKTLRTLLTGKPTRIAGVGFNIKESTL